MSVIQRLKEALPIDEESAKRRTYECQKCGTVFESEKNPDRVICSACSSTDVEPGA
jgi:ribosomal protein S27AE